MKINQINEFILTEWWDLWSQATQQNPEIGQFMGQFGYNANSKSDVKAFVKQNPGWVKAMGKAYGAYANIGKLGAKMYGAANKIPKDRMLPNVKGLRGPFSCLNNARFGISWGALGAAMACFHSAKTYALSRIQFDHPIASYQLVQNKLAWMLREITKGQLLAYHLGRKKDDGTWFNEQISLAKMNNVDIALEIARVSRDIHGANGVLDEYPVMRHMANLESVKTYEGTHDIHNLILGRYITGIQAFTRTV